MVLLFLDDLAERREIRMIFFRQGPFSFPKLVVRVMMDGFVAAWALLLSLLLVAVIVFVLVEQ